MGEVNKQERYFECDATECAALIGADMKEDVMHLWDNGWSVYKNVHNRETVCFCPEHTMMEDPRKVK